MDWSRFSRDDWIVAGVALLLVIDLLFLPWLTASAFGFTASLTATDAPSGWLGVLAVLAALAVIADLAIERLSSGTQVPAIGGSRATTRFVLAIAVAVFVALKFFLHVSVTTKLLGVRLLGRGHPDRGARHLDRARPAGGPDGIRAADALRRLALDLWRAPRLSQPAPELGAELGDRDPDLGE